MTKPPSPRFHLLTLWAGELDPADAGEEFVAEGAMSPGSGAPVPLVRLNPTLTDAAMAALVDRVIEHDERALALLYEQLAGAVYALVLRIVGQVAVAEEVLEDVFWQVWRQAPRFDAARGHVRSWVLTIARTRAIDAARTRRREAEFWGPLPLDEDARAGGAVALGPPDLLAAAQDGSRLHRALLALQPVRRQLVALSFFHGLTQQEIAERTGLPLGTVKSHLRRSLLALAQALGQPPETDTE